MMKQLIPVEEEKIRIMGRTNLTNPLPLYWTASGVEFVTDAGEVAFNFETDFSAYEEWIRVEVDGFSMLRTALPKGESTVTVFRGFAPGVAKRIQLFKEVQAMGGDPSSYLLLKAVAIDGELLDLPAYDHRIEFIGDSITSCEGLAGSRETSTWVSAIFSTNGSYALETAGLLKAEPRILSQSGWGTYCAWDNNPDGRMPRVYGQVCGVLEGTANQAFGCGQIYQSAEDGWKPDAVVINLGTNDGGAFNSPAFVDGDGKEWKQVVLPDGSYEPESIQRFQRAVVDFLHVLRQAHPDAVLLWVYGMLGNPMQAPLEEAIASYQAESGDQKVFFQILPDTQQDQVGSNGHPGIPSHRASAQVIAKRLEEIWA